MLPSSSSPPLEGGMGPGEGGDGRWGGGPPGGVGREGVQGVEAKPRQGKARQGKARPRAPGPPTTTIITTPFPMAQHEVVVAAVAAAAMPLQPLPHGPQSPPRRGCHGGMGWVPRPQPPVGFDMTLSTGWLGWLALAAEFNGEALAPVVVALNGKKRGAQRSADGKQTTQSPQTSGWRRVGARYLPTCLVVCVPHAPRRAARQLWLAAAAVASLRPAASPVPNLAAAAGGQDTKSNHTRAPLGSKGALCRVWRHATHGKTVVNHRHRSSARPALVLGGKPPRSASH